MDSPVNNVRTKIFIALTQNFEHFSYFVLFHFFKSHEKTDFVTQLVPSTAELISTGFFPASYVSPALLLFQKVLISQKSRLVGVKISLF